MRLMLGRNGCPELLVEVSSSYNKEDFEFTVINGAWEGRWENGFISFKNDPESKSDIQLEILTDNQDRLRGEYNDVFNNFDDINYVNDEDYSNLVSQYAAIAGGRKDPSITEEEFDNGEIEPLSYGKEL